MSFEAPALLLGLLLVPLAALGYWLLQRRPAPFSVRYTNLGVLASVVRGSAFCMTVLALKLSRRANAVS